jgi:hypothetical protein
MSTFLHDLRVAARQLAGHPSFTLIVIVTLALSIGAMTTCFAVLNAVAFRPLPFTDPDSLVAVHLVDRRAVAGDQYQHDDSRVWMVCARSALAGPDHR